MATKCCQTYFRRTWMGYQPDSGGDTPCTSQYRVQWAFFQDPTGGEWTSFGSLNGVDLSTATLGDIQTMFETWQGQSGIITCYVNTDNGIYIQTIQLASDPPFTDYGEYISVFDPENPIPVTLGGQTQNCTIRCYTATFTMNDAQLAEWSGFTVNGIYFDVVGLGDTLFSDPGCDAIITGFLEDLAATDPDFQLTSSINGNDITVTIQSILPWESVSAAQFVGSPDPAVDTPFTPCP